ncbi:hypothetical protein DEO72_LG7g1915 [Vigna unguiculata]|uniref:Uncharacterized protein n=1 Tax=Vigna unguiculata TaxID=3917 RepID=A0A4D6MLH0_VIGUN|nr:hypothetical protein DEO72_LG7g1915 [Vigna unguiculata]
MRHDIDLRRALDSWGSNDQCVMYDFQSVLVCNSLESLGAVSSTHLDVYKRQGLAQARDATLGGEQRYPPQVQASAKSDQTIRIRVSGVSV